MSEPCKHEEAEANRLRALAELREYREASQVGTDTDKDPYFEQFLERIDAIGRLNIISSRPTIVETQLDQALFALVTGLLRMHVMHDYGDYLICTHCTERESDGGGIEHIKFPCPTVALVRKVCPPELYEAALVALALERGGEW